MVEPPRKGHSDYRATRNKVRNLGTHIYIYHKVASARKKRHFRVACFGETAERIASRAKKGDRLYVEARWPNEMKGAAAKLSAHPHTLRHSCGYYLADRGTDFRTMQD